MKTIGSYRVVKRLLRATVFVQAVVLLATGEVLAQTLLPPALVSPANGSTGLATSLVLDWDPSIGATEYRVQVSTNAGFFSLVFDSSGVVQTSFVAEGLAENTTYYWRVRASTIIFTSNWSPVWNFTTRVSPPLPPPAPVLLSPANAATGQPLSPTLTWNTAAGADRYHLQVSTSATFGTLVVDDTLITGTSQTPGPLNPGIQYFWRVRATNAGGTSIWSSVWSFTTSMTPPSTPALASPTNGAPNQPVTLTLSWSSSTGADRYHLQLSTSPAFASLVLDDTSITGVSREVGPLTSGTQYYWRVRGANSGGTSNWSAVWSFTTGSGSITPPATPVLASPPNGAPNQPSALTLTWNASTGAERYHLQVSTSPAFETLVMGDTTITGISRQVGPLVAGVVYYWRTRAENTGGVSNWSAVWSFATGAAPPPAPALLSPSNGSTGQPLTLTLAWNPSTGADRYDLQVSTSLTFATLVVNDTAIAGTSRLAGPLGTVTQYYWRARGWNSGGAGSWSAVWSFTTGSGGVTPPEVPVLAFPLHGATGLSPTPNVGWHPAERASSYRVQVSAEPGFSTLTGDMNGLQDTSVQIGSLAQGATYYWRARANNSAGNSNWSTSRTFSTAPPSGILPPPLVAPSDGAVDQPTMLTLRWSAATGATTYHVQVSTDQGFSSPVVDQSGITSTQQTVSGLGNGVAYYWRVRGVSFLVTGPWSDVWSFTTVPAPPSAPELASPTDGATNQSITPTLSWSASLGATRYHLQVSTSPSFATMIVNDTMVTTTSRQVGPLATTTQYYWRARGANSGGASSWSSSWSFMTADSALSAPTLIAPANGATHQQGAVLLTWNAVPGAVRYHVELGNTADLATTVISDSTLQSGSYSLNNPIPDTTYFWHVRARGASGWGSYSATWSFTTTSGPSSTITISGSVDFPHRGSASEYNVADYRMVGLPGASSENMQTYLPGTHGVDWELYRDNGLPSDYLVRFNGDPGFRFTTGRAFWLVHRGPWSVNATVPAAPLNSRQEAEVPLQAGWNLITNPFTSSIAWSQVQVLNLISEPLYSFDGGFAPATSLEPYKGYYFFNATGRTVLCVPSPGDTPPTTGMRSEEPGVAEGWKVTVSIHVGSHTDHLAWFGCSPGARDGLDPLDWRKPRGISPAAEVYFDRPLWDSLYRVFASDIRSAVGSGTVWTFSARSVSDIMQPLLRHPVQLTFDGVDRIPAGYAVHLIDDSRLAHVDLRADSVYRIVPFPGNREFRIVVGTDAYVQEILRAIPVPQEFVLENNYPNPFNPSTTIPLAVPRGAELEVSVFDLLGRKVKVLFSGNLGSGRYPLAWDGTDEHGRSVASGPYFVRLETTDGIRAVRRMLLMK